MKKSDIQNVSRRKFALLAGGGVAASAGIAGCIDGGEAVIDPDENTVVASMPAVWDMARQVAGDDEETLDTLDVVPVGRHGHDWEPEPATVEVIEEAAAFIYLRGFASWQDDAAEELEDNDETTVIEATEGIDFFDSPAEDDDEHFWMDPVYAKEGVDNIAEGLADVDPENEEVYMSNAGSFKDELEKIHEDMKDVVEHASLDTIIVATHDSYQWWYQQYDISVESPVGTSPDDQASPDEVEDIEEIMNDEGIEHVLYDVGEPAELAANLADETGADILPLSPLETQIDGTPELDVTDLEMEPDWGYKEHFYEINIPTLKEALDSDVEIDTSY